ncbi:MAG: hypothetical protein HOP10_02980 [Chitinophagaceae bacterium]|nr:hypothetical protein [Chitinophagaceae bacterium]
MKNSNQIHNLDTLEKEIFRQQLISKKTSRQLEDDLDFFRDNFFSLARNSVKKERKKEEDNSSFFEHIFKNDHVRQAVDSITGRITDHASEAISRLIDRLFQKHK